MDLLKESQEHNTSLKVTFPLALPGKRQEPADTPVCLFSQFPDQLLWATLALYKFRVLGVQMQSCGPGAVVRNSKGAAACLGVPGRPTLPGRPRWGGEEHVQIQRGTGRHSARRGNKSPGQDGQCAQSPRCDGSWAEKVEQIIEDREGPCVGLMC